MKKILFLIHDLGKGGAEKVLVNLVNNMDSTAFDITVMVLFGGGVNEQFLNKNIKLVKVFPRMIPGNTKWMKLLSPRQLHSLFIRDTYDIEVSYLEGPSARVIAGCPNSNTKLVSWVHEKQRTMEMASGYFRSSSEAEWCYGRFDCNVFVSKDLMEDFRTIFGNLRMTTVLYNTIESERIIELSKEPVSEILTDNRVKIVAVGTLKHIKGYDRLLRIIEKLKAEAENDFCLYILGEGPEKQNLKQYVIEHGVEDVVVFEGYQTNPYKYVAKCDLFVCSSYVEGFSTAATEALIVGTPVCTVEVPGMKEMLGEDGEFGVVVENDESALYQGIKNLIDDSDTLDHYKTQAEIRGKSFSTVNTVRATEKMLLSL